MNNKEKKILTLLEENARLTSEELSDLTGITKEEIEKIIDDLTARNIILGYKTVINEKALQDETRKVRALIEVRVRPEKKTGFDAIANRIAKHSQVVDHYLVSGTYDFLILTEGSSLMEISQFVSEKLASIENVITTTTHFMMKKYKEKGVLMENSDNLERIVVVP